jgi:lambda family phage tail tape measure protein
MAQGDVGVRVGADTTGLQAGMVQAAVVTEAQMKKIAQMVRAANDATANLGKTSQKAASDTASAYSTIADGAKKVEGAHAGVNRELLVLAHEMSQGNYSKFGGSLLVLAERTNFLSFALSGTGILVSTLGAAVLGAGALMAMGAIEADKFGKALQLTGNYAAVTEQSIRLLAEAQSKQTGQSVGSARGSAEAAAGSGLFGPSELSAVSRAMGDYQKLTRATAEEALKNFASIQDGVAKWAEEQNKSVHFLTSAEFEHIKSLEESGQKQAAAIEALNAYAGAIETRGEPAVGALARAWHAVADWASHAGQAIMDVGRPTEALTGSLAAVDRQIALVRQANTGNPAGAADLLNQLSQERARLEQMQFRAGERRSDSATNAAAQAAAIEADKYIDSVLKGAKALSMRTEELKKWDAAVAARAAAGNPMAAKDVAAGRAEINKKFEDHGAVTASNEYANLMATIKAFNQETDQQVAVQRKLTDAEQFSIRAHEELEKSGKALTAQKRSEISAAIDAAAAHRKEAEILAKVHELNTPQQNFRSSEIGDEEGVNKAFRDAQLAADAIRHAQIAQQAFNDSASSGYEKASRAFMQQASNNAAFAEQVFNDSVGGMTDALVKFAETGKLSFKSLIDTMINDLIRFEVQQQEAKLIGGSSDWGGGNSPLKLLGSLGSDSSSGLTGTFGSLFSGEFGGGYYANGLDYVPYDGFPAILHEGERVTSRQDAAVERAGGGTQIHIDQSGASYGAGVDVAGVSQIAKAQADRATAEIFRTLSTRGVR